MKNEIHRSKNNNNAVLVVMGIVSIIVAVVLLFLFLMQGESKTTGEWFGAETTESLSCKASNLPYPVYETNNILNSTTQINATFNGGKLDSISLLRKANYANADIAKAENDILTAAMNTDFSENGMKAFALNATFSFSDEMTQMSLYANQADLNSRTMKYFMLDSFPAKIDDYQEAYQSKGFKCEAIKQFCVLI